MQLTYKPLYGLAAFALIFYCQVANADTIRLSCDLTITTIRDTSSWAVKERVPLVIIRGPNGNFFDAKSRALTIRVASERLEGEAAHLDSSTPEIWEIASAWDEKGIPAHQTHLRLDRVTGDFFYSYSTFDKKTTIDAVGLCKKISDNVKKF